MIYYPKNLIDYMEWLGAITGILGAIIISSNIGHIGIGYISFLISSIAIMYVGLKLKRFGLLVMNSVYLIINIWGIWRWLLMPLF